MSFLERAKSMHERGETVRAAVLLAEGLKREPEEIEALEWLLHLYVEEIRNPGLEREILKILELQENGHELLALVEAELRTLDGDEKLEALERVRERDGLLPPPGQVARTEGGAAGSAGTDGPHLDGGAGDGSGHENDGGGTASGEEGDDPSAKVDEWASFANPIAGQDRPAPVGGANGASGVPVATGETPASAGAEGGSSSAQSASAAGPHAEDPQAFAFDDEPPAAMKRVEQTRDERLKWLVIAGTAGFVFLAGLLLLGTGPEETEVVRFVPAEMEETEPGEDRIRSDGRERSPAEAGEAEQDTEPEP